MANLVPEGLTADVFNQAVAEMHAVVGKQWVFAEDQAALRSYRAAYGATPDEAHLPSAAVAPDGPAPTTTTSYMFILPEPVERHRGGFP